MARGRHSHRVKRFADAWPRKDWWSRIALGTERAIAAVHCMVFTDVVFAAEGMFEVPSALMKEGTLGAASDPVVHAGRHRVPHFRLRLKTSTKT